MQLIPVILCGGAGSRLWPFSRQLHPKPFIRLSDGYSLLQKAFLRAALMPNVKEVLTVTNSALLFKIKAEFREINHSHINTPFILEPFGRNTAAAVAAAALHIAKRHSEDTLLLILAADHLILDQEGFQQAVATAYDLALSGKLVTFGIQPHEPNTAYGYIEADGNQVLQFIEKPTLEKAEEYLATKRFLWNSGMFLFQTGTLLQSMAVNCPEILSTTQHCLAQSQLTEETHFSHLELEPASFSRVPDNSIDYAVMEKSNQVAVVPCDIQWTDVGSWNTLGNLLEEDMNGNRIDGQTCLHDVANCHIQSNSRLVGAVGIDNLIIIDTPDALLVANKTRVQDVKHIYTQLKQQDHEAHKHHRTVYRPWGSYTVLEESAHFKIKRIVVKQGEILSLQMHHHRSEHWIVVSGMAKVTNDEKTYFLSKNESTYIPASHKHRLENPGKLDLIIIEVQSGEYLGEDDIVRYEDNYGRV